LVVSEHREKEPRLPLGMEPDGQKRGKPEIKIDPIAAGVGVESGCIQRAPDASRARNANVAA
jgi:hypothetical protein